MREAAKIALGRRPATEAKLGDGAGGMTDGSTSRLDRQQVRFPPGGTPSTPVMLW